MLHAVPDTNILVSALMPPDGPPGRVMAAALGGELQPVVSRTILAEYGDVFRRPRLHLDAAKVEAMLSAIHAIASFVHGDEPPPPAGLPDDRDWPFIACALAAGCPVVTGNVRHFPERLGVRVMTAREWVEAARQSSG